MFPSFLGLWFLVIGGSKDHMVGTKPQTTTTYEDCQSIYEWAEPMLSLSQFIYDFIEVRKQAKNDIVKLSRKLNFDRLKAIKTVVDMKSEGTESLGMEGLMVGLTENDITKFKSNFKVLERDVKAL